MANTIGDFVLLDTNALGGLGVTGLRNHLDVLEKAGRTFLYAPDLITELTDNFDGNVSKLVASVGWASAHVLRNPDQQTHYNIFPPIKAPLRLF